MQEEKEIISGDYKDKKTGIRFLEDVRGNLHHIMTHEGGEMGNITINIPEIHVPESKVTVEVIPPADDLEKQRLLRVTQALRAENNWLWQIILTAIIDRKKKGAATAMDKLEQEIKERQR